MHFPHTPKHTRFKINKILIQIRRWSVLAEQLGRAHRKARVKQINGVFVIIRAHVVNVFVKVHFEFFAIFGELACFELSVPVI